MKRKWLAIGIILFFLFSTFPSTGIESNLIPMNKMTLKATIPFDGPMNSAWPMYGHDEHHTGRSPYNSTELIEKWRFKCNNVEMSPVIDNEGIVYFGDNIYFYAVYPNGTLKWKVALGVIWDSPAIGEDGTIYVPSWSGQAIFALNPDGTILWNYDLDTCPMSSVAMADDGTIYVSTGWPLFEMVALNSNGTKKWRSSQGWWYITSTPVIGNDGTLYFGSHDGWFYAIYPNNGTLKWKFQCGGNWVAHAPSIADDGTIYIGDWDDHLYAFNPDGTIKWVQTFLHSASGPPSIGTDGTIYITSGYLLYAIFPNDGSIKWTYESVSYIGLCPLISDDGKIFVGSVIGDDEGGELIVIDLNGNELWRKKIADAHVRSSPVMASDGTVYIGSSWWEDDKRLWDGYLHAFGPGEQKKIIIEQPEQGKLYLFNRGICKTLLNNTIIIGSVNVKVHAYSLNEIESVHFCVDGVDQYNLTEPPFEWRMSQRYGNIFPLKHTISVTGYYKGGCSWTESIDIIYFHL